MILTQAAAMAMPGVPGIYFHSLFGSRNYLEGVKMTGINRSINREKFNVNWLDAQLQQEGSLERKVYMAYKRLLSIRINETAFDPFGPFLFLEPHPGLFCIHRESQHLDSHIFAVHNFRSEDVTFSLPDYIIVPATECIANAPVTSSKVTIEKFGVMWIKCRIDTEKFEQFCLGESITLPETQTIKETK
jgi:sucrose phosphorylase